MLGFMGTSSAAPMSADSVQLATDRLLLRPLELADFEPWAALMADGESARFLGGSQPRAISWRIFMCMAGAWHLTRVAMFSVIERTSGRWVGRVGPWMPEGWPGSEIGWAIVKDCWGRGYATEAARASMDWAFDHLGWHEVIHCISPDNAASQAVARKLGARNRGPARMPPPLEGFRVDIWGQTAAEWRTARAGR